MASRCVHVMHAACPAASACISCVCFSKHRVQTRPIQSLVSCFQGPPYYLHNGGLAFNLALLLALGLPLLAALQHLCRRTTTTSARSPAAGIGPDTDARQSAGQRRKGGKGALSDGGFGVRSRGVAALAPLWLWLTVISLLPHKEERFLYVVYPLVSPGMTRCHIGV
jgi:Alg9-like mannosyltransferase family